MHDDLVNGKPATSIAVNDRGFLYGDGLFETIAVRDGNLRFFDYHLDRLRGGCARLGLAMPEDELLAREARELLSERRDATLRITLTRGSGPRGYAPPENPIPVRVMSVSRARAVDKGNYRKGIRVRICATPIGINPAFAGLKTLNRLDQVLARSEWADSDIAEGLMSTPRGEVICGTMSNLFYVDAGVLLTPSLELSGVCGVMRRVVIEQAGDLGFSVAEVGTELERLQQADEIFMTNSQFGIWPVRQLDATRLRVGPITKTLMASLSSLGVEECLR